MTCFIISPNLCNCICDHLYRCHFLKIFCIYYDVSLGAIEWWIIVHSHRAVLSSRSVTAVENGVIQFVSTVIWHLLNNHCSIDQCRNHLQCSLLCCCCLKTNLRVQDWATKLHLFIVLKTVLIGQQKLCTGKIHSYAEKRQQVSYLLCFSSSEYTAAASGRHDFPGFCRQTGI